jgi:hypothetical protein
MSVTRQYSFTTPADYIYDTALVEITGGEAKLKLVDYPDLDFTEDFADDTGFTYDAAKAEFVGGVCQQKDQRPVDSTFGATYTNSINGNWGNGTLTGTAGGGATVSSGKLDLSYNDLRYVRYSATDNINNLTEGTVKFKVTPNYTGVPTGYRTFFSIIQSEASPNNSIGLWHYIITGSLYLLINNSAGVQIVSADFGGWLPVSGTEYEFEVHWQLSVGDNRLFINGVQKGGTNTNTGALTALNYIKIGTNYNNDYNSNFKINDF